MPVMKPYADNIQTFAAMFEGYAAATARFHHAVELRDTTAAFIPLFEALNWAVALDDRAAKHWAPEGKALGFAWRERVRDAETMQGVRFVRNSVHHQWSDALELDETGRAYPRRYPVTSFEWRWRAFSELPEPDKKSRFWDSEVESYQGMLAGQPARHALQKLASAFHFLRQVLEPSSITRTATPPIVTSS